MKYSVNILIDAGSYSEAEARILDAFGTGTEIPSIYPRPDISTKSAAPAAPVAEQVAEPVETDPPADDELTPAQKAAATRKRNKEAKEAEARAAAEAKKTEAAAAGGEVPPEEPKKETAKVTTKVTEGVLKKAVNTAVDTHGVGAVRGAFKTFGAARISDIKEKDYAAVVEALEALGD